MKQQIILQEQQEVNQTIQSIEQIVTYLEENNRYSATVDGQYRAARDKKRRESYRKAMEVPYIGKLEVVEDGVRVTYRIGKVPVTTIDGLDSLIIDWQSPIGDVFYSFQGGNGCITYQTPAGEQEITITRKRNVVIRQRKVEDLKDILSDQAEPDELTAPSLNDDRLMQLWFESREDHKMRDIVASIQREQNEMIRLGISSPILIQGVAGSGKTSIALHRISYLLYQYPKQLSPEKILILAPNGMFIQYIQQVIQDLDIESIAQDTVSGLCIQLLPQVKSVSHPQEDLALWLQAASDPQMDAVYGPQLRYKTSLEYQAYVEERLRELEEAYLPTNFPQLNSATPIERPIGDIFREIYNGYKHLPLNQRRIETTKSIRSWLETELNRQQDYLKSRYLAFRSEWIGALEDEEAQQAEKAVQRLLNRKQQALTEALTKPVDAYLSAWKPIVPYEWYRSLCERAGLAVPPEDGKRVGYEDLGALLHVESRLGGLDKRLDYLVIDEVQDTYPYLIASLKPLAKSMTLLGDISQNIHPWIGMQDWSGLNEVLGPELTYVETAISYRSTRRIMELANHVLSCLSETLPQIQAVRHAGDLPAMTRVDSPEELVLQLRSSIERMKAAGHRRIAIIPKEPELAEALFLHLNEEGLEGLQHVSALDQELTEQIVFIPSTLVKGLEFEAVIIPNASELSYDTELDARLLFISITRAQEALELIYYDQPSRWLASHTNMP
ncbi:UvrD-helicase domain-containing protein [Paenibacillus sp. tmac-D7]|uniref:HelD family protein n=1 Tax=Paenibacillus sp. tmac-D7 TaxID=2591462 RepID=UPI001142BA08|nr:UvrD-helicase domain-containing protein [Paenibacillus sp. tmac-D7]